MNIVEALDAARECDKAITRKEWGEGVYIFHGRDNFLYMWNPIFRCRDEFFFSIAAILVKDYELCEEPYHGREEHRK